MSKKRKGKQARPVVMPKTEAERLKIPFLGEVPIFTEIREGGDRGVPVVVSAPDQPAGEAFLKIARSLWAKLG